MSRLPPLNNSQMIQIKPLSLNDLQKLEDKACFSGWSKFDLLKHSQHMGALGFGAFTNKHLIGLIFSRLILDEAEILTLEVAEEHRQQGVGKNLLQNLLDELKLRKAKKVFLEVKETNFMALKLYTGYGFSVISKRDNYYSSSLGKKINALILEYTGN